jgi:WbqC-like protein family
MTTAIMQPTYLPWAGYFNLIHRAGRFVFLNDVKFEKSSWQTRNRILLQGRAHFITAPTSGSRYQLIREVPLASGDFRSKHRRLLEQAYAKHPHGPEVLAVVLPIISNPGLEKLQDLNLQLIFALCRALDITSEFVCSSELAPEGERSARLLSILQKFGERDYLSPPGSADYIAEDGLLEVAGIAVEYQQFEAFPYPQRTEAAFEPRLSIVDVVANLGFELGRKYVTQDLEPSSLFEPAERQSLRGAREPALRAAP